MYILSFLLVSISYAWTAHEYDFKAGQARIRNMMEKI